MFLGVADSLKEALARMREEDRREREAALRGCSYCGRYECGCGAADYHPAHPAYSGGHRPLRHRRKP